MDRTLIEKKNKPKHSGCITRQQRAQLGADIQLVYKPWTEEQKRYCKITKTGELLYSDQCILNESNTKRKKYSYCVDCL